MSAMTIDDAGHTVEVASGKIHLLKRGQGEALLVLHDDVGRPGWLPFYEELARRFTVYSPSFPGYGQSDRLDWMRSVRDLAIVQSGLLKVLGLDSVHVVGLGFGAWVAAEMATMCQRQLGRMALVGAVGIQPSDGEIVDQFLMTGEEYARLGFHDKAKFEEVYGSKPTIDQEETWEVNREMTTRIAWKPYMFNQTLPILLRSVDTPTLIVWGKEDRIVPLSCAQQYVNSLPNASLKVLDDCGHSADMERPMELTALVADFIGDS